MELRASTNIGNLSVAIQVNLSSTEIRSANLYSEMP